MQYTYKDLAKLQHLLTYVHLCGILWLQSSKLNQNNPQSLEGLLASECVDILCPSVATAMTEKKARKTPMGNKLQQKIQLLRKKTKYHLIILQSPQRIEEEINMFGIIFACIDISFFILLLVPSDSTFWALDGSNQHVLNEHSCCYWLKMFNFLFKRPLLKQVSCQFVYIYLPLK